MKGEAGDVREVRDEGYRSIRGKTWEIGSFQGKGKCGGIMRKGKEAVRGSGLKGEKKGRGSNDVRNRRLRWLGWWGEGPAASRVLGVEKRRRQT
ncbi:hypothetical protein GOBAR_AA01753 [Gossypium barbadense]|uniref:Uncharacterized protein n=1 Tax=Gossypium barbadense TaxID=3634 RepID=A0A2P5YT99_GOSBA|nr:hypothetical protein GOBAR_AA01753 [Gossypium barbadense]